MNKKKAIDMYKDGSPDYRKIYRLWNNVTIGSMKGQHVHHIDHNHYNNDPRNLQLMTPSEHALHHAETSEWIGSSHTLRSRFRTEGDFQSFCDSHRRGSNNSQYGNIGRISGIKNPMVKMTPGERVDFGERSKLRGKTPEHLAAIAKASKCPQRREKVSKAKMGNKSNQVWAEKIRMMCEEDFQEYLESGITGCRRTQVLNIRTPPPKKEPWTAIDRSKEGTLSRLKSKLKGLTNDAFTAQMEGKGHKYIKKMTGIRNS